MKYRDFIEKNTVVAEQTDIENNTVFMLIDAVNSMKDGLEQRVDGIKDMLDEISGLTEIEDIKEKVKELVGDLY
ncbi:MAG: hypothetical protein WC365_00710 [Candidatus Babeliales bacterium]|jgi:hypothetical protein